MNCQSSDTAALAASRQSNALFQHIATQIGIHQTAHHLLHGLTQSGICQIGFTHPFGKLSGFKDAAHETKYATQWHKNQRNFNLSQIESD
jgi:hypothetical protein